MPVSGEARWMSAWHETRQRRAWLQCAEQNFHGIAGAPPDRRDALSRQATACTRRYLASVDDSALVHVDATEIHLAGEHFDLELRGLSRHLAPAFRFRVASDVPMPGWRYGPAYRGGFGVPVALLAARCSDAAICALLPPEGIFRPATAWIEAGKGNGARPRLVIADPNTSPPFVQAGGLASDHAAFYMWGTQRSPLKRLGVYALLRGDGAGKRAGLYLLEDYDPRKQPVIMVHGLGSSPLGWAKLSSAIWNDRELSARYQVWHMVYSTDAPLLVLRHRLQQHLDHAWNVLDPEGDDDARRGAVFVGHSLGGVLARLLCSDSGTQVWDAAFAVEPNALAATSSDLDMLQALFHFKPYAGVSRAIFLAAPHRGSPVADTSLGKLFHRLVGRRAVELEALRRVARDNPDAVREGLRSTYFAGDLNSIVTLRNAQPIRLATESLLPPEAISFHTVAALKPGAVPNGDGIVPLSSAILPGAASTRIVQGDHKVHLNDAAIDEVLRVLRIEAVTGPVETLLEPR